MSDIGKSFILAGKSTFTVQIAPEDVAKEGCSPHYTYRVKHKAAEGTYGDIYFVSLLTGPDNEASYSYVGVLDPASGRVRMTAKSKVAETAPSVRVLRYALEKVWTNQGLPDGYKIHHEGQCGRCGRKLTTPESVERGIGPECWKMG